MKSVAGTGERPRLTILVKSSVFERGHSMGEDCSIFEIGLPGEERTIELEGPVATAPGKKILLLFVDVRNVGPNGPVMHQRWELHSDNGKNN